MSNSEQKIPQSRENKMRKKPSTLSPTRIKLSEELWDSRFPRLEQDFELPKYLSHKGKHLDYGSGVGYFAKLVAERYPGVTVHGADIKQDFLDSAQERYPLPNLKFMHADDVEGGYDTINANLTLHEILDAQGKLKELYQKLKRGGKLMIHEFRKTSKKKFREQYDRNTDPEKRSFEEEYEEHNRWTMRQLEQMCKNAGFKTLKIKKHGDHFMSYIGEK